MRELNIPLTLDFIQAHSYRSTASTGRVAVSSVDHIQPRGSHVILVEDIVDTGTTLSCLTGMIQGKVPASLKICALLDKPSKRVIHANFVEGESTGGSNGIHRCSTPRG